MPPIDPWELCQAAVDGRIDEVRRLLDEGADPSARSIVGALPLARAAARGSAAIVALLLAHGAPLNALEERHLHSEGGSALIAAAHGGHLEALSLLLEAGADTELLTDHGETALSRAAAEGHLAVAELLLDAGAAPNRPVGFDGKTALMVAAEWRREELVSLLLARGADPTILSSDGRTAVHFAAGLGYGQGNAVSIVTKLLEAGCPANLRGEGAETALFPAARFESADVVRSLLEGGADPCLRSASDLHALLGACRYSRDEGVVRALVKAGAPLDGVDGDGYGPLARICNTGESPADGLAAMLEGGASVKEAVSPRASLLFDALAAISGEETTVRSKVRLLLEAGVDPTIRAAEGATVCHRAARRDPPLALVELLRLPAIRRLVNEVDEWKRTALHWAARDGHVEAVTALIEAGADAEQADRDGNGALHLAFREDHVEVVKALLKAGASPNALNALSRSAIYYAQGNCLAWLRKTHPALLAGHDEGARRDRKPNCATLASVEQGGSCSDCGWSRSAMEVDRSLHCPRCGFNGVAITNYEVLHGNPMAPTADTEVWFTYGCAHCGATYGNGWNALNSSHPHMSEPDGGASWQSEDGGRTWRRDWGRTE